MIFQRSFFVVCVLTLAFSNADAQQNRKMTTADVERQLVELSNWGRWGKDDQLGTLNLITPEKRVQAAKLVHKGISVSLARNVEKAEALDNPAPFKHEMSKFGRGTDTPWATDILSVDYHGFAHTHMDALCHLFYKGKLYNGFSRDQVGPKGAEVMSVHNVKEGIFTRGILFDIPRLKGVRFLEPGTAIYPEDLDAWEKLANVKVESGDVIFICTGRWARREIAGPWSVDKSGAAGLHASCAKWLKDRDIAMLGSDGASDVVPSGIDGIDFPVHLLTLHAMGVHIFDNCDLEALRKTAEKLQRWEFLLTASPLPVTGGTGSPLNPIATY
ncbi:MAG: cyclase family protein [Planctomycetes bacterium]|nr:cyclase family protein [Planctomycetota bacterium]